MFCCVVTGRLGLDARRKRSNGTHQVAWRGNKRSSNATLKLQSRHGIATIDFHCPARDESNIQMEEDAPSPHCCCRIRCHTAGCLRSIKACAAESSCVYVQHNAAASWATLKKAPDWWDGAPGVKRCQDIAQSSRPSRSEWHRCHCEDYTKGDRLTVPRNGKLVFDIGFHSGEDTIHFLERGYDVVAADANPLMIDAGLTRPTLRVAKNTGQLRAALKRGMVQKVHPGRESMTFYVHRTVSEWSTFNTPSDFRRKEFDSIEVNVVTCGNLIRRFGTPFYLKVDIEGFDKDCLLTLERSRLPNYISTEVCAHHTPSGRICSVLFCGQDPAMLDHLVSLGYESFKMVDQSLTRRGNRQFSGGMPEEAPGKWSDAASVRSNAFWSLSHMHVSIDNRGNRRRLEHDLHARLRK